MPEFLFNYNLYFLMFDLKLIVLSAVIIAALMALFIIFFDLLNDGRRHRSLKYKLILYFASHIVTELCFLFYFYAPHVFLWMNGLLMLSILLIPVFLYAFIYEITAIDPNERFSKLHYLIPLLLTLVMVILSFVTPVDDQMQIIKANGAYTGGSILFFIFSNKLFFRLGFTIVYVILSFRRLPAYRRYMVGYSSNEVKTSLHWVPVLLFFIISLLIVPLHGVFISRSALALSFSAYFQVAVLVVQHSFLAYHVVKGNYILQELELPQKEVQIATSINKEKHSVVKGSIDAIEFDSKMKLYKPYLEANLKISDLAEKVGVNRTYLSTFINTEYNMNFSSYINMLRLKEYKNLREKEEYKDRSNSELAEKAGFGSYRSYTRCASQYSDKL